MTVSRTLSGGKHVRPELQERVWAAVRALGFRRNENARNLRPGQASGLLGVTITNLANPYYGEFATGVEEEAAQWGRRILLGSSGEDAEREHQLVDDFLGRRVEGLIVVPAVGTGPASAPHLAAEHLAGCPLVLASRLAPGVDADAVILDDEGGAHRATTWLLEQGHRRIGYLGNVASVDTGRRRFQGFERALAEAGLLVEPALVHRNQQDVQSAAAAMRRLLDEAEPPTAVFAANNRNAIGALTAVANGRGGPQLVSFDDFELAALSPVPLAVIQHDARELGRTAARMLLERIGGEGGPPRIETLPVELRVVRSA